MSGFLTGTVASAPPAPTQATIKVSATVFYADQVNARFKKTSSHYVTVKERINEQIKKNSYKQQSITGAVKEFQRRHPNTTSFLQLKLVRTIRVKMDEIDIDTTMQRMLNVGHVADILTKFKELMVMPISVYEDPSRPGRYICWDGQHTLVVLYLIAEALGCDISQCEVPVCIYESSLKSDMRINFIKLNGEAKDPLHPIDIMQQKVFGVRVDHSKDPDWVCVAQKQTWLETYKMFATHTKFGDTTMPGALTRVDELLNPKYSLDITEKFCKYFWAVCRSSRPVGGAEPRLLYEFFKLCNQQKIPVDDAYVKEIAASLKAVGDNDFDIETFWQQSKDSYANSWYAAGKSTDGSLRGIKYDFEKVTLTFLLAQLKKNFAGQLPDYPPLWIVPNGDLF